MYMVSFRSMTTSKVMHGRTCSKSLSTLLALQWSFSAEHDQLHVFFTVEPQDTARKGLEWGESGLGVPDLAPPGAAVDSQNDEVAKGQSIFSVRKVPAISDMRLRVSGARVSRIPWTDIRLILPTAFTHHVSLALAAIFEPQG